MLDLAAPLSHTVKLHSSPPQDIGYGPNGFFLGAGKIRQPQAFRAYVRG
jgi:hypothetical protein